MSSSSREASGASMEGAAEGVDGCRSLRTAKKPIAPAARAIARAGTTQATRSNPSSPGVARTSDPYSATRRSLISSLVSPRSIRCRIRARCRSACGASESSSNVPQIVHMTSSSMSGRLVRGVAAGAAAWKASNEASRAAIVSPRVIRGVVEVDPEHGELVARAPLLERLQGRRLGLAGATPRGPEVDQHPLAAVVLDSPGAGAVEPLELLVGRGVAEAERCLALAEQAEAEEADDGHDGHHDDE